jgi:hypothetical protein
MYFSLSEKKNLLLSFILIIIIFLLSSNIAWINPDTRGAIKVISIPLFWQYDVDSILELGTATYFPELFKDLPARVTRPLYPMTANALGNFFYFLSPIKFDFIYFVAFSYFLIKICIYFFSAICLIKICTFLKFNKEIINIILLILFLNSILIKSITSFHTTELQILLPVISTFFYILFIQNKINIFVFALILGILFLGKNNYAIVMTIILHLIYYKRFNDATFFIITFFIPLILWVMFYKTVLGLDFSFIGHTKYYGWFNFESYNINFFVESLYKIISSFVKSYIVFFIFIPIYIFNFQYKLLNKRHIVFIVLFCLSIMLQMFITNKPDSIYMTKDINFIYCIILGLIIYKITNKLKFFSFNKITFFIFGLILLGNSIISLGNFPLIHPYNQKILEDHSDYIKKANDKYEK